MIWKIKEGEICWVPDLPSKYLPPKLPLGIKLHIKGNILGLEAQGLAGALPLLNGDTLQILPKIDQVNFLRLFFKAEGFQGDLETEYQKFVSYTVDDSTNFISIVARQMFLTALEILKLGAKTGRERKVSSGDYLIGQVNVSATALNLSRKSSTPVVTLTKEKTTDIPENRIITAALYKAWTVLSPSDRTAYSSIYSRWTRKFSKSSDLTHDLQRVEERFAENKYGGARDYYRKPLMLAKIILGYYGVGFGDTETIEGDAVLLNTANIFEKYIRNTLREAHNNSGYVIEKDGIWVTSLYTDGSYELHPDIIISKEGRIILIADVKYKSPTQADHYQLNSYLNTYGLSKGILIAPLFDKKDVIVKEYSTAHKSIIREIYLPMSDLDETEATLKSLIRDFA